MRRADGVVWRAMPGRILVRRVHPASPDSAAAEFSGAAAMVWAVLDEPGTLADVQSRLSELGHVEISVDHPIAELTEAGWIVDG